MQNVRRLTAIFGGIVMLQAADPPPPISAHAPDYIVLAAYGDTRTGPFGLGSNRKSQIHEKVVAGLLQHTGIDAVLFSGDAVMSSFPLTAGSYWKDFLHVTNTIVNQRHIPFFPVLGNHEVLPPIVPAMTMNTLDQMQPPNGAAAEARIEGVPQPSQKPVTVPEAYDLGESSAARSKILGAVTMAPDSSQGKKNIASWTKDIEKGDPRKQAEAAMRLGQFEGAIQKQFYELSPQDKAAADAGIFRKDYSDRANYSYLGPLTLGFQRSYYSQIIVAGSLQVKLIALDTNHLDSVEQQSFFQNELQGFDGKIVVFGHHPPVTDDAKQQGAESWDAPDGWDKFRPFVTNEQGKNIAVWIFGHVHDYQRRGASNGGVVPAPAFVVAGGGGASLDAQPPVYQWQPDTWDKGFITKSSYSYVILTFTNTEVKADVFSPDDANTPIDSFSITYRP